MVQVMLAYIVRPSVCPYVCVSGVTLMYGGRGRISWLKPGFHRTQRTQRTQRKERKERKDMTSLLDRPITAASDDGVCRWHAAKL